MSSEIPPERPQEVVGRTWADVVWRGRGALLAVILLLIVVLVLAIARPDLSGVGGHAGEIEAFIAALVLGVIVGRIAAGRLHRVRYVDYLVLDFEGLRGAIYRIPVPQLARMEISGGSNLVFSWRTGQTVRLARRVDLRAGVIETAWPHEVPIEQAAYTLSDLQAREEDYERCKIENLMLRRRSMVIAADLARQANTHLADEISDVLQLGSLDVVAYMEGLDPLKPHREDPEDGAQQEQEAEE